MAIIPQLKLFEWTEIQTPGDLERLSLVLEYMPDEELMKALGREERLRDELPMKKKRDYCTCFRR